MEPPLGANKKTQPTHVEQPNPGTDQADGVPSSDGFRQLPLGAEGMRRELLKPAMRVAKGTV